MRFVQRRPVRGIPTRFGHGLWWAVCVAWVGIFVAGTPGRGDAADEGPSADVVVVIGAAGTDEYAEPLRQWAAELDALRDHSDIRLQVIGSPVASPDAAALADVSSESTNDRQRLRQALAERVKPVTATGDGDAGPNGGPTLWLILLGHGTFADDVAKFNLVGPDVSAAELAQWLSATSSRTVIVNAASCSGPFVNRLSGPDRVVVTATQSGDERDWTRFGGYFVQAIISDAADLDHDDETSVLEAFVMAAGKTRQFYRDAGRIASEHALIDDNGDAQGTPAQWFDGLSADQKHAEADGNLAKRITLVAASDQPRLDEAQRAERDVIEGELETLKRRKPKMNAAEYWSTLEALMLRQAELYQRSADQ
ncbi:hypothetical protein [Crateriforma spongiae]|uniref:hypothetical protein n=1 Tax=Crateriforma spongiae TaxID=2724528 RepID=UPI0014457DAB|nr:hypothetical protein [Crateriforma spongiae]